MSTARMWRSAARSTASLIVLLLVGALAMAASVVLPATAAQAATIQAGPVKAQMANHRGVDNGTRNNCITYAPRAPPPAPRW